MPKPTKLNAREPTKFQGVFLMMGTFHIILTFMAVLAARYKD